jgi:hypothetical protein
LNFPDEGSIVLLDGTFESEEVEEEKAAEDVEDAEEEDAETEEAEDEDAEEEDAEEEDEKKLKLGVFDDFAPSSFSVAVAVPSASRAADGAELAAASLAALVDALGMGSDLMKRYITPGTRLFCPSCIDKDVKLSIRESRVSRSVLVSQGVAHLERELVLLAFFFSIMGKMAVVQEEGVEEEDAEEDEEGEEASSGYGGGGGVAWPQM